METIDVTKLPVPEKLKLMEELWDSMGGTDALPTPPWHDTVLENRLDRLDAGDDTVSEWDEAKRRIRSRTKTP
ncbi:MAG TPA: addiction module protein [Castellaniella sp.]|jgi:putative addiction module component (TIGR02574 family)|nr:addiction module protein [Castellaniella sp.]